MTIFDAGRLHNAVARLLDRLATNLSPRDADRYLVRDAQRVIEAIEALVRIYNAQAQCSGRGNL